MNSTPPTSATNAASLKDEAQTWKLVLSYDGSDFYGWQVQPGKRTVQGDLASAIERITGERVLPQGSGRTDAGVHALGQVASFPLTTPIPAANLRRALNRTLPAAIRIHSTAVVEDTFHARHSAIGKTYEYRIYRASCCPPFLARYAYALDCTLDVEAMQQAAAAVVGEHDFTSFAASDPDLSKRSARGGIQQSGNTRILFQSEWVESGDLLLYRVRGSGFLHHMVRNLVGTFLEAGRGHSRPIADILAAKDRRTAGPTAPARGLFLVSVDYPDADAPHRPAMLT